MSAMPESFATAFRLVVHADSALVRTVALSLAVSGSACLCAAGFGLASGAWLAVARFPGQHAVLVALDTLLALPSVVEQSASPSTCCSRAAARSAPGASCSPRRRWSSPSTILVLPIIAALARQVVADALRDGGDPLRSMGAGPLLSAMLMLLHERWSVVTVLLTAFGRAVSEVGAVMIVGGNIDGLTRVITTTIALETSKGDLPLPALALGLVLLVVIGLLNVAIALLRRGGGPLAVELR